MRILMLSVTFPYPPTRGGTQVRTFNFLKYLQQNHDITLVTQRVPDVTEAEVEGLKQWVKDLIIFPKPLQPSHSRLQDKLTHYGSFLWQGTPPNVQSIHCPKLANWITQQVADRQFDAITCEHSVNEIYVHPAFRHQLRKTVVNIHSSVYGSCRDQLTSGTAEKPLRDRLYLPLLRRYEQRYCQKFSDLVVTTAEDQKQMSILSPHSPIHVIPNGVDLDQFPMRSHDPGGHDLVFMGAMDNLANIDAALFLSTQIFPTVRQRYPQATLTLVGARPTVEILALKTHPGITVTGKVPAVVDYLHQATVAIVPMRTGYGIKNKTLESMAAGVPVVASDRGLEGLAADGQNVPLRALRANRPEEYIDAISRLFDDASLRQTLSQNARSLIETDFTWTIAGKRYEQVLSSTA